MDSSGGGEYLAPQMEGSPGKFSACVTWAYPQDNRHQEPLVLAAAWLHRAHENLAAMAKGAQSWRAQSVST